MVIPLFRYRGLIWQHALADLRNRYAGTGLGIVWNVLHPLALIAIYSVVFGVIFQPPPGAGRYWYLLYLCSGLLPWISFSETITRGATAFSDNAAYLKKLPIPEPVFVAQAAASATLGLAISFTLLFLVAIAVGHRPGVRWLLLPLPLVALQALGFGFGLLCGTLNVFFRDIAQLLSVGLQVVMWTAPVVYLATPDQFSPTLLAILQWHPIVPSLTAIRELFLFGQIPGAMTWLAMFAWPAGTLLLAGTVFSRLRTEIRDVL